MSEYKNTSNFMILVELLNLTFERELVAGGLKCQIRSTEQLIRVQNSDAYRCFDLLDLLAMRGSLPTNKRQRGNLSGHSTLFV